MMLHAVICVNLLFVVRHIPSNKVVSLGTEKDIANEVVYNTKIFGIDLGIWDKLSQESPNVVVLPPSVGLLQWIHHRH